MQPEKVVREALELAEPLAETPPRQQRLTPRTTLAVFCGLVLVLAGSLFHVRAFAALSFAPELREPDWPLVFKGFSATLSSSQLALLEKDALREGRDTPVLVQNAIEIPTFSCMAQVDACLDNKTASLADVDMSSFFQRLDDCLARAAKCAREAEDAEAERALANANEDLLAAVHSLERGGVAGAKQLAGAFRGASAAVAREFPAVASFLRDVAERVVAFLAQHLPLWIAAAKEIGKEIGGEFAVKLLAALEVLKEHMPGLAHQCKCGLGEGARALKVASAEAVQLLQAELPVWTAEAKKAGMGAIVFAEGFLKDLPKVVDMCKTELEKQLAKDGKKAVIQKALVVGAAVGAVGFWMHHNHKETQKRAAEEFAELAESVAERRSLRAKASESRARGWPEHEMLTSMYRLGLWEDFGRQAGRMLKNAFENKTVEEQALLEAFPFFGED